MSIEMHGARQNERSWEQWKHDLDYLENCASAKVDLETLELMMEPEDEKVSSKVHPAVSRR